MQEEELKRGAEAADTLMAIGLAVFVVMQVVTIAPHPFSHAQLTCAALWLVVCGAAWRRILQRRRHDSQRACDDRPTRPQ